MNLKIKQEDIRNLKDIKYLYNSYYIGMNINNILYEYILIYIEYKDIINIYLADLLYKIDYNFNKYFDKCTSLSYFSYINPEYFIKYYKKCKEQYYKNIFHYDNISQFETMKIIDSKLSLLKDKLDELKLNYNNVNVSSSLIYDEMKQEIYDKINNILNK